eukprot:gene16343-11678_t
MHAFLDYEVADSARMAIQELHGLKFMGRIMRVNWASAQAAKEGQRPREQWAQVHVAFSTPHLQLVVTEELLEEIFGRYGTLADITVKRHSRTVEPPCHTGYAFLYYFERHAAMAAAQSFAAPIVLHGIRLQCNLTAKASSTQQPMPQVPAFRGQLSSGQLHLLHPQTQQIIAPQPPQAPQWSPFSSSSPSMSSSPSHPGQIHTQPVGANPVSSQTTAAYSSFGGGSLFGESAAPLAYASDELLAKRESRLNSPGSSPSTAPIPVSKPETFHAPAYADAPYDGDMVEWGNPAPLSRSTSSSLYSNLAPSWSSSSSSKMGSMGYGLASSPTSTAPHHSHHASSASSGDIHHANAKPTASAFLATAPSLFLHGF